jgi:hypothetical protein
VILNIENEVNSYFNTVLPNLENIAYTKKLINLPRVNRNMNNRTIVFFEKEILKFDLCVMLGDKVISPFVYHKITKSLSILDSDIDVNKYIYAPTLEMVQRWLRDVVGINIGINYKIVSKKWDFIVYHSDLTIDEYKEHKKKYVESFPDRNFNTYEEALEEALLESIFYLTL